MRIILGELRSLIAEASRREMETLLHHVIAVSQDYVESAAAGSPDRRSALDLRTAAEKVTSYAKWMLAHRDINAEPVAMVAKYANDLAKLSEFWQRPTFLGKDKYVDKLKMILQRMQRKQVEALSNRV